MSRSPLLLLALLLGCAEPPPEAGPMPSPLAEGGGEDLSRVDVRGTAESIVRIEQTLESLSPEARAQAADSLALLSVHCPYTRSALQLPFALRAAIEPIEPSQLDPLVRGDLARLQDGLDTHVAVLESLGVDLPLPGPGDGLFGGDVPFVDRARLDAESEEPLLLTSALVRGITALAERLDPSTSELIELHSARVGQVTGVVRPCPRGPFALRPGQPWTLGMQLGGWHDALRRIEPFATDPQARSTIRAAIELLDAYGEASFVSRSGF